MDLADAGKAVGAVVALVGGLYSGGAWVDTRYAHVSEVRQVEHRHQFTDLRLEEKILTDRVRAIQERMWSVEDRYPVLTTAPVAVREEYRQMVADLADVQRQIQSVMDTYRQVGYPASSEYYHYERPHR